MHIIGLHHLTRPNGFDRKGRFYSLAIHMPSFNNLHVYLDRHVGCRVHHLARSLGTLMRTASKKITGLEVIKLTIFYLITLYSNPSAVAKIFS